MRTRLLGICLTISISAVAQPRWASLDRLGQGDTLKLLAEYTDCGEWGGHHESILIYKESGYVVKFMKDSVKCSDPDVFRTKLPDIVRTIDGTSRRTIEDYILLVDKLSKGPRRGGSNANNVFYIILRDKEIVYVDSFDWDEFEKLVKQILH
jgi:hypothetical protein